MQGIMTSETGILSLFISKSLEWTGHRSYIEYINLLV